MNEYWDCECRLSKSQLYELLYATTMLGGAITSTLAISCRKFNKKQNSRHYAFYRVKLPVGKKEEFEEMSGLELKCPPKIHVN